MTILFADITDFTKMSARLNAEEAHSLLEVYFARADEIVRLHPNVSVVVKATASGFLVVFTDAPHVPVLQSSDFAVLMLAGLCVVAVASLLV